MNTTLPPARDLPPHAHARIRARLEFEVTHRRGRRWLTPALSGVAALLLVAFFAWPGPTPRDIDRPPARPSVTAPPSTSSPAQEQRPAPDVPGVPAARKAQIEKNCATMLGVRDAVLYQLVKDAAGEGALLYTRSGMAVDCQLGEPKTFYNPTGASTAALDWLPGPMSVDTNYADAGGDDGWLGHPGLQSYAGRVTSAVARVTYTDSGVTQRAVVANGTFFLRIVRPSDWMIPADPLFGVLRAYDADGTVLATIDLSTNHPFCLRLPNGEVVPKGSAVEPEACRDGVPWR